MRINFALCPGALRSYTGRMKTQRTHLLALRAASQVTAVSRAFRKIAAGTAASALIMTSAGGCSSDVSSSAAEDAGTLDSDIATQADVSSLLDVILGSDSASPRTDAVAGEDTDGSDGRDGADLGDVEAIVDIGSTDMADGSDSPDAADVAVAGDVQVEDDAMVADASPDAGELPETCLIPNGKACETSQDCNEPDMWGEECVDGECHDADFTSAEAQACCDAQYNAGNFGVPGCNPWGPPAPPADRGYRLAHFTDAVGVA